MRDLFNIKYLTNLASSALVILSINSCRSDGMIHIRTGLNSSWGISSKDAVDKNVRSVTGSFFSAHKWIEDSLRIFFEGNDTGKYTLVYYYAIAICDTVSHKGLYQIFPLASHSAYDFFFYYDGSNLTSIKHADSVTTEKFL